MRSSQQQQQQQQQRMTGQRPEAPIQARQQQQVQQVQYSTRNLSAPISSISGGRQSSSSSSLPYSSSGGSNHHRSSSPPTRTAKERLEQYNATKGNTKSPVNSELVDPEDATLVQYLALQAYHLPGYSWKQDWWQFMMNNHPVLGIFCHHPRHPIKSCTRVVALIGSVVVGLAIANMFYLFYLWNPQFNQPLFTTAVVGDDDGKDDQSSSSSTLTTGMLLLWTVGGALHCTYNLLQWYIAACACCRPGGMCETKACCPSLGKHLLRVLVVIIISMAALVVLLRVAITNTKQGQVSGTSSSSLLSDSKNNNSNTTDSDIHFFDDDAISHLEEVHDASEFEFIVGYLVEILLSYVLYYPIGGTILFSGILGCGRIPILGGRPLEIKAEERRLARRQARLDKGGTWTEPDDEDDHDNDDTVEQGRGRGDISSGTRIVPVEHFHRPSQRGF